MGPAVVLGQDLGEGAGPVRDGAMADLSLKISAQPCSASSRSSRAAVSSLGMEIVVFLSRFRSRVGRERVLGRRLSRSSYSGSDWAASAIAARVKCPVVMMIP